MRNPNNNGDLPKGIRKIVSPISGKVTFEATAAVVDGKKIRREFGEDRFAGIANALAAAKHWQGEARTDVRDNRSSVLQIPPQDRWVYLAHIEEITEAGMSFKQCLLNGLKYHREHLVKTSVTIDRAVTEFLDLKRRENCKESYFKSMAPMLRAFAKGFENRKISELTTNEIEAFLAKRDMGPVSWNNWRRDLRTLFNFAKSDRNRWVRSNPAEGIALKKIDNDEVKILSLVETILVLRRAHLEFNRLMPFLVLGLFGGLRREEIDNGSWEDVDWELNTLRVRNAKNRSVANRYVHMEPVLIAWLKDYRQYNPGAKSFAPRKYARRNDLQLLSKATGVDCTENVYRHSFGSYHLGHFRDKAKTMLEMGHSNQTTFDRYYRKPVQKSTAGAYWDFVPEKVLGSAGEEALKKWAKVPNTEVVLSAE